VAKCFVPRLLVQSVDFALLNETIVAAIGHENDRRDDRVTSSYY